MEQNRIYVAIDLKSFYASVECLERGLDPLTTNLVVADASRTQKTICLAVSPSLKAYGIPGRPRLFEVVRKMKQVNARRIYKGPRTPVSYITAPPRMELYMDYSTRIYNVYLKYVAPEDIHVYSIDEVFIDITNYFTLYKLTPYEIAKMMIKDVFKTTGVTATVGIGTNLYLAKVAMDIHAKNIKPDKDGGRIVELDEMAYRKSLWTHHPITDFWRVGTGYAAKLEANGIYTMGDIARCSIGKANEYYNEDLLYKLFGINAELLIDHAWGWEPCTMADIKSYKPKSNSIGSGQVLHEPYTFEKAKLIVKEMTDLLVLDLVTKRLVTNQMVLTIGYDIENLNNDGNRKPYHGEISIDSYGRKIPKQAHGTTNLSQQTSSTRLIMDAVIALFDRIVDENLLIRRVTITANNVILEDRIVKDSYEQLDLFLDLKAAKEKEEALERERKLQESVIQLKKKYGKNAILKGMNFEEGATTISRNKQIGGHKA
ncbi:MAG TPA: DNA methylase [Epulopiscium sp.]|nr:DNA methylase [Candidatus Epulonipiscium sp.]